MHNSLVSLGEGLKPPAPHELDGRGPAAGSGFRSLRFGAPGADDSKRSADEIRIIKEMCAEEVEQFLQANNIDVAAARELRNEPPHVALAVLERGPLRACVNPSGALVARIRDAKRGMLGAGGRYGSMPPPASLDPNASELDRFLSENRIDQAGVASIKSETESVQKAVMAKGPFINTTNPSASLMARIRTVKMDLAAGGGGMGRAGMLALPPPPVGVPAPPPPSIEDRRANGVPINEESLTADALKAIQKLTAPPPAKQLPQSRDVETALALPGQSGGNMIENTQDWQLQSEALKAIQQLNADI